MAPRVAKNNNIYPNDGNRCSAEMSVESMRIYICIILPVIKYNINVCLKSGSSMDELHKESYCACIRLRPRCCERFESLKLIVTK